MKVLLYATKAKPYLSVEYQEQLFKEPIKKYFLDNNKKEFIKGITQLLNGKVCAMFEWGGYEKIKYGIDYADITLESKKYLINDLLLNEACLTYKQLKAYGKGKDLYAWHIDNLQVFDEPIELEELYSDWDIFDTDSNGKYVGNYVQVISTVKKSPQSYQYVYYKGEKCLLLSIKSEWLYKILNGEKTVEISKSVPKELR